MIFVLSPIAANSQQQTERAVALCDSGMTFLEQGDTENAHDLLNQALRLAP